MPTRPDQEQDQKRTMQTDRGMAKHVVGEDGSWKDRVQ